MPLPTGRHCKAPALKILGIKKQRTRCKTDLKRNPFAWLGYIPEGATATRTVLQHKVRVLALLPQFFSGGHVNLTTFNITVETSIRFRLPFGGAEILGLHGAEWG